MIISIATVTIIMISSRFRSWLSVRNRSWSTCRFGNRCSSRFFGRRVNWLDNFLDFFSWFHRLTWFLRIKFSWLQRNRLLWFLWCWLFYWYDMGSWNFLSIILNIFSIFLHFDFLILSCFARHQIHNILIEQFFLRQLLCLLVDFVNLCLFLNLINHIVIIFS